MSLPSSGISRRRGTSVLVEARCRSHASGPPGMAFRRLTCSCLNGQTGNRILSTRSDTFIFTEQNHLFDCDDSGRIDQIRCPICKGRGKMPCMFARAGTARKGGTRSSDASNTTSGGRKVVGSNPGSAEWQLTVRCQFLGVAGARSERPQTDSDQQGSLSGTSSAPAVTEPRAWKPPGAADAQSAS